MNVDGLPISKSSGSQFWPILEMLRNIPNSFPFLIGIYHGPLKPKDVNLFLADFVNEMMRFLDVDTGFTLYGRVVQFEVIGFVCDAPARAFITCTKSHTGYYSCSKCCEGEWDGRVVFLENDDQETKRRNASFRNREN